MFTESPKSCLTKWLGSSGPKMHILLIITHEIHDYTFDSIDVSVPWWRTEPKIISTVNGLNNCPQGWRKAACIAREDTVLAKSRSLSASQTQHEENPNTPGFLAECYHKEEECKFTTKQLSTNVQCRNLCKNPRQVNVSERRKAKVALKSNTTLMQN